jgi:hypothetical protein
LALITELDVSIPRPELLDLVEQHGQVDHDTVAGPGRHPAPIRRQQCRAYLTVHHDQPGIVTPLN